MKELLMQFISPKQNATAVQVLGTVSTILTTILGIVFAIARLLGTDISALS